MCNYCTNALSIHPIRVLWIYVSPSAWNITAHPVLWAASFYKCHSNHITLPINAISTAMAFLFSNGLHIFIHSITISRNRHIPRSLWHSNSILPLTTQICFMANSRSTSWESDTFQSGVSIHQFYDTISTSINKLRYG